jgi:hypothetical protein
MVLREFHSKIEERKFVRTLPEYASYRERTGFLLPRLRQGEAGAVQIASPRRQGSPGTPQDI